MATGHYISGIGHGALLAWALIGGLFSRVPDDAIEVAEVSIISSEEFAALSAPQPAPEVEENIPTPPQPEIEDAPAPPVAEAPPEVPKPPAEETPPPVDVAPDVVEAPPPIPDVVETPPEVVQPPVDNTPVVLAPPATTSSPRPAPRVAPTPVQAPPADAEVAEEAQEAATPEADTSTPSEVDETTAPEETTDVIVTEADKPASSAPTISSRPSARPKRPTPVETAASANDSTPDTSADTTIDDTLRALQAESSAPTGPSLTGGEKDAFLVDVRRCWNVGALSTAALQSKVVVRFELSRDGKPDIGSIRMTGFEGGSESVAKQSYETARRAIIRCGATGYKLPIEKYEQWKIVNITFNPENMRLK